MANRYFLKTSSPKRNIPFLIDEKGRLECETDCPVTPTFAGERAFYHFQLGKNIALVSISPTRKSPRVVRHIPYSPSKEGLEKVFDAGYLNTVLVRDARIERAKQEPRRQVGYPR